MVFDIIFQVSTDVGAFEQIIQALHRLMDLKGKYLDVEVYVPVNSKLNWNDNLAAIFEAKLTFNRPSSSVPVYCICRRG